MDGSTAGTIEARPAIEFDTHPSEYRHWRLDVDPPRATLTLAVTPEAGLRRDYDLKLNSYDLAVDIELHDAVQRLRFEQPDVRVVIVTGGLDKTFCAGANIQMLAGSSHAHKVGFCKFTNETRNAIEEATTQSGQTWIAAVNGTAAGGGYELALACDEILLVDDRASAVSLPEVPLLAVLPGTGGLTRLVDKRHVRRDLADLFATRAEGARGRQALEWGLVDAIAPPSGFEGLVRARAEARAATSDRPAEAGGNGIELDRLHRVTDGDTTSYRHVEVRLERDLGAAHLTVRAPSTAQPSTPAELEQAGAAAWIVAAARELDDAVLHLRFDEPEIGTWVLRTAGDPAAVLAAEELLSHHAEHWLVREVRLLWTRALKRLDLSSRTIVALLTPGSCFAGTLAELALGADRTFMLEGAYTAGDTGDDDHGGPATLHLTEANAGWYPMANALSRLATRFYGQDEQLAAALAAVGRDLDAARAAAAGLVTSTPDDLDWDDEVRLTLEERHSFSPDALTAMEANLRFAGPETMETKIFARLTAWQNWVFQRPNATGPSGALQRFGTGSRPDFDRARV
ncbi:MAG: benzoyl-CoA-dihydrodiol lyase [Acidimicrobiia bacterium]|nr:benzoyl-CoA-dihydrodiol lyase [Acidimicrobiia bacterium]